MKCTSCNGDGWYVTHAHQCDGWGTGECNCGGVQVQCEACQGTGDYKCP